MIAQLFDTIKGEYLDTDAHQFEAYDWLLEHPRAALFLEMSLSKTVIALSYLYDMHYRECAFTKTLVVAPDKVARITWPDEIKKWGHLEGMRYSVIAGTPAERLAALNADAEVFIVGIDNLTWLIDLYIKQRVSKVTKRPYGKWFGRLPFDSILLDELSMFKSRDSVRFDKLRRALKLTEIEYRIGMTGTPAPNGLVDLWAQILLIDDGQRFGDTFAEFKNKYFTTRGNGQIVFEYIPRPGTPKVIAHKLRDIALSMKTRDNVKLPDLYTVDHDLEFNGFDQDTYDALEMEYVLEFASQYEIDPARFCIDEDGVEYYDAPATTVKTPADLTNKLLQVTSGAIYEDREDPKDARVWHELNTVKLDALGELLDQYPDETFILVYQYRHEIERIKKRFPFAREIRKGKKTQEDIIAWNNREIRLLIIHPASAGHGLNLQFGGRRMVWFTLTWNLEHYLQTVARLLRRGALEEIFIHRFLIKGTRDHRVRKKVEAKETDQNFLMNETKQLLRKYGKG